MKAAVDIRRRPVVPPTRLRKWIDARSHNPPESMTDNVGAVWQGTSRVLDPARRRQLNRRSWRRLKAEGRRAFVASRREAFEERAS